MAVFTATIAVATQIRATLISLHLFAEGTGEPWVACADIIHTLSAGQTFARACNGWELDLLRTVVANISLGTFANPLHTHTTTRAFVGTGSRLGAISTIKTSGTNTLPIPADSNG